MRHNLGRVKRKKKCPQAPKAHVFEKSFCEKTGILIETGLHSEGGVGGGEGLNRDCQAQVCASEAELRGRVVNTRNLQCSFLCGLMSGAVP